MGHVARHNDKNVTLPTVGLAAVAFAVALFVYRPFDARPFEFLDFPEFFGILENGRTLAERTGGIVAYYEGHGRANVLAYALIAVRWSVFGRATAGWQVTRFLVMCAVVVSAYFLLRRFGTSRVGAAAGASLFVTTAAAAQGWLRLSMMEPLATLFVLLAALVCARFQRAEHWPRWLGAIAVLLIAAILTKEVIVAAIPLVALVGLCIGSDGALRVPERSRRNITLIATTAVASALALVPTVWALLGTKSASYAASYGTGSIEPSRVLSFALATLIPFDMFAPNVGAFIATSSYVLLGAGALIVALRAATDRRAIWIPLTISGLLTLGGAVAYLPWPSFELFYTIPYLVAPALLIGLAVTAIERHAPGARWAAYVSVLCVSMYALSQAHANARRTAAAQRLVDRTAGTVAKIATVDTAVFAVRDLHPQRWQGTGPTIARYARAVRHLTFPYVVDAKCQAAYEKAKNAGQQVLVVVLSSQCAASLGADSSVREPFARWDWGRLRIVSDTLRADLIRGKVGRSPALKTPRLSLRTAWADVSHAAAAGTPRA
jgi:hypothetical protein